MNKDSIEFIRVIIGLRDEYVRNQNRLNALKELVKVDPEKYSDYYFYLVKNNQRLALYLQLVENKKAKKSLKDLFKKPEYKSAITLGEDGLASIDNANAIIVYDQATFSKITQELLTDSYLNGNFSNLSVVGRDSLFKIKPDAVTLDSISNDNPFSARYISFDDMVQCVYYYPLYNPMEKKHAEELLFTEIPRENISHIKQSIIDNNPNTSKDIILRDDLIFDRSVDRTAKLNLEIEDNGQEIILHKKTR